MKILLLSAFEEETKVLKNNFFSQSQIIKINQIQVLQSQYLNHQLYLGSTGIGTVCATTVATLLNQVLAPDLIIYFGTAGGIGADVKIGDIVVASGAIDMDIFSFHKEVKGTPFESTLLNPIKQIQTPLIYSAGDVFTKAKNIGISGVNILNGLVATSHHFPTPSFMFEQIQRSNVLAIDMESSAIYQMGWLLGVNTLVVRAVSNLINNKGHDDNIHEAKIERCAENLAKFGQSLLNILSEREELSSRYKTLNLNSVCSYLLTIPSLRDFFGTEDVKALSAKEIGDGNLNLVFIVTAVANPQRQLIVKQAVPYLRCVGESFPLDKERMHYEIRALKKAATFTPSHVPKVYHADEAMCVVVMQYLGEHIIMRKGMIRAIKYPRFADHISTYLAESLFRTSSLCLTSLQKTQLIAEFNSNSLRQLTEDFVFTFPYMPHETNQISPELQKTAEKLWADSTFKQNMLLFKDLFMNKTDALLHGDLHTGSIMINQQETYVIDPEFAYVGPFGFDIGAVLSNLIMAWVSHFERTQDEDYQHWILTTIHQVLTQFEQKFLALWNQQPASPLVLQGYFSAAKSNPPTNPDLNAYQQQFMLNMFQQSIGFAGCKIARRQLGVAGVEDIRGIADPAARVRSEIRALTIARELVVNYRHYKKVDDLLLTLNRFAEESFNVNLVCENS